MKALVSSQHASVVSTVIRRTFAHCNRDENLTFEQVCELHPEAVREVPETIRASFGSVIYTADEAGFVQIHSEYFDSSD